PTEVFFRAVGEVARPVPALDVVVLKPHPTNALTLNPVMIAERVRSGVGGSSQRQGEEPASRDGNVAAGESVEGVSVRVYAKPHPGREVQLNRLGIPARFLPCPP